MREVDLAGGWSVRWMGNLALSAVLRGPEGQRIHMSGAEADALVSAVTGRINALVDALAEAKAALAQSAASGGEEAGEGAGAPIAFSRPGKGTAAAPAPREAGPGDVSTRERTMTISTTPVLIELAEQRAAEQAEAEAFRVAHLAATLSAGSLARGNGGCAVKHIVDMAREILAESRRAVSASTTEDSRG